MTAIRKLFKGIIMFYAFILLMIVGLMLTVNFLLVLL